MDASKAAMDTPNAALAQPVLGLFTPHGVLFAGPGPFPSSPYPLACPEGRWPWAVLIQPLSTGLPGVACRMPGAVLAQPILGIFPPMQGCPVHPVQPTLAAHTYFQEWWSHPLHTPQNQGGCNHPRCCIHIWETVDLVTSKQ
ncbi:hypothetical protein B0H14DRAFT_2586250 [Mycena olivaceomarginata]|nr:hypothetical protein B0H14DRAFT_2586250 [Mycena olivaceomarginata]